MTVARWSLLVLAVASLALGAQAQEQGEEGPEEIHVVAHDDATPCVGDEAPCYEIVDDAWGLVSAGSELDVVFENNASREHALNVAAGANASEERDTNRSSAFAQIGPIAPGTTVETTIAIPLGTDTAYLFCHEGDHEDEGLHLLRNVYPAGSVEEGRERGPGLDEPNESPTPVGLAPIVLLASAVLLARRIARV